jgi:hypothetical protein
VPISGKLTAASLLTASDDWTSADNGSAAPRFTGAAFVLHSCRLG